MGRTVWVVLFATVTVLGISCKSKSEELAERAAAAEAVEMQQAHDATQKRLEAAKAEAARVHENDEFETARSNNGREACKRAAAGTRDCLAGKACLPLGDGDGPACLRYMQVNNLENNPF